jgi:hypothetical protein
MKQSEITEGFWDNVAHPIAYAKGVKDPNSTGAGNVAQQQSDNELSGLADEMLPMWKEQAANDAAQKIPSTPERFNQWAQVSFPTIAAQLKQKPYDNPVLNDNEILKYLKYAFAVKHSKLGAPTQGTQTQGTQTQGTSDPTAQIFADPAAFKAEWDKYVASSPNYQLISDVELLTALKDMWMRTGGTKIESKKNTGQRL